MTRSNPVSRYLKPSLVFCLISGLIFVFPPALLADPSGEVPRTSVDQIHFDASTTRAFDRSGRYVTTKVKADGTVHTELNGSFQNVTVARIGANGVIETYCTTSEQDAKNWMARADGRPDNTAPATTLSTPVQDKTQ
jgi:hypothetical protein